MYWLVMLMLYYMPLASYLDIVLTTMVVSCYDGDII